MTEAEKLTMVKTMLQDPPSDELLSAYLTFAKQEILGWRYSHSANPPTDVPMEYEMVQVMAVITGFTQSGVEGQTTSVENGIHRHFRHSDMVDYIRSNVIPIAGVPRSASSTTTTVASGGDAP